MGLGSVRRRRRCSRMTAGLGGLLLDPPLDVAKRSQGRRGHERRQRRMGL